MGGSEARPRARVGAGRRRRGQRVPSGRARGGSRRRDRRSGALAPRGRPRAALPRAEARQTRGPRLLRRAYGSSDRRALASVRRGAPRRRRARTRRRANARRSAQALRSGEERGDGNVRVEDGAHSAAAGPCLVLGLDGELEGLPLAQIVSLPQTVQQVETELAAQRLFDHLAVALPDPRSAHLDRTQGPPGRS